MNKFMSDNFNISEINLCLYVVSGKAHNIHKNRPHHGLVAAISGIRKYVFDNGKEMTVYPCEVFYLPKFSSYKVISIEKGDCIAINFELTDENVTYPFFKVKSTGNKYKKDFENLLYHWNLKKDGHMNLCYMHMYNIICNIQSDLSARYVPSKAKLLAYGGSEYIAQNIEDYTLTVERVSDRFQVSPEYFRKIFNDVNGVSPKKYIIDMRMDKAKKLLLTNEFSIGEIGRMCGYESESYFSAEFKRICGCSPSKYNKSHL